MKKKQYVVFDFDGTLADTLDLVFNIFNGFAHEYQFKPVTWEDKENIRSKKPQELLKIYGISYLRLFTLILRIRKELAHHIRDTKLVEEMRDSLVALRNAGYRMGILTSNSKENVSRFLGTNRSPGFLISSTAGTVCLARTRFSGACWSGRIFLPKVWFMWGMRPAISKPVKKSEFR